MGRKILVVDDEEQVRTVIQKILETFGYEVAVAEDGVVGLRIALENDDIDLVLTDVVMPNLGGFDMVTQLLAKKPNVEIIFMSAYTGDEQLGEQVSAGKARFLAKPFKPSELERKVKLALF
ncbi:MAG: response regulator [Armatimonadota bacterium]|nr:response regulator [Armatimonadota bacterium]